MLNIRLYCGNVSFEATDSDLRELFESVGEVIDARIHYDENTGRSRGFGTVLMASQADTFAALALRETLYRGRRLLIRPWRTESVRYAQPHWKKA